MGYTKGDWQAQIDDKGGLWVRLTGAYAIAEILTTNEGDAHLIAAAPKQNEALKAVRGILTDIQQRESKTSFHGQRVASDCEEGIKVIDEALAKAEGK